ncbi:hypothetical protein PRUPE_8G179900 [Prunus persica]|uniref:Dynamin stalk domain-containing protein n=1 Tax=Prunus persica TaxID=3760 RepID=A0A251N2T3_PRUPE|nr:hypothetical protein PRUPE_8G179900 [Prunus persica]
MPPFPLQVCSICFNSLFSFRFLLNLLEFLLDFSFACTNPDGLPISTDDIFQNGQIRPVFLIFNPDLLFANADDDDFSIAKEATALDDLIDDDIQMAIQMLLVPFEFLVRRQTARLLDPSLQCLRFVYDELMKISHACEVTELQRFPVLRKHLDEVMVKFLRHGVEPAKRMIGNLIEMEVFPFAFAIVSGETMDNWRWQQRISNLLLGFFV